MLARPRLITNLDLVCVHVIVPEYSGSCSLYNLKSDLICDNMSKKLDVILVDSKFCLFQFTDHGKTNVFWIFDFLNWTIKINKSCHTICAVPKLVLKSLNYVIIILVSEYGKYVCFLFHFIFEKYTFNTHIPKRMGCLFTRLLVIVVLL